MSDLIGAECSYSAYHGTLNYNDQGDCSLSHLLIVCSEFRNDDRSVVDFHDVVDRDKSYYEQHSSQLFVGALMESLPFRIGILVAILMNSIVVGLQTNKYLVSFWLNFVSQLQVRSGIFVKDEIFN